MSKILLLMVRHHAKSPDTSIYFNSIVVYGISDVAGAYLISADDQKNPVGFHSLVAPTRLVASQDPYSGLTMLSSSAYHTTIFLVMMVLGSCHVCVVSAFNISNTCPLTPLMKHRWASLTQTFTKSGQATASFLPSS
eukprot:scaffold27829_cov64-Cyclotella_meneghiniana.AAC.8